MYIKYGDDETPTMVYNYGIIEEYNIGKEEIEKMKKTSNNIKLGLTDGGIDTTDSKIIDRMSSMGVAVELADYYLKENSTIYRSMMSRLEKDETIREFKLIQEELKNLKDLGYVEYIDIENILRKIEKQKEIEEGRISCIGETNGCMETTNGGQYCCKHYCPHE